MAPSRSQQPAINVTEAALVRSSSVSMALSEMLADLSYQQQHFLQPKGDMIRRLQYYDGDAWGTKRMEPMSAADFLGISDELDQNGGFGGDLRSVAGIMEFVEAPSAGDQRAGVTWLNGKMNLLAARSPRIQTAASENSVAVQITDSTQQARAVAADGRRDSGKLVSRRRLSEPTKPRVPLSRRGSSDSDRLTPARPSSATLSEASARPVSAGSTGGGLRTHTGSTSSLVGAAGPALLRRSSSTSDCAIDRVCWGDVVLPVRGPGARPTSGCIQSRRRRMSGINSDCNVGHSAWYSTRGGRRAGDRVSTPTISATGPCTPSLLNSEDERA